MAKIGILTFHRAENFGAVLQAYALQCYLASQGHDVEIIDYRCNAIEHQYKIFDFSIFLNYNLIDALSLLKKCLFSLFDRLEKKIKYKKIRKHFLNITDKVIIKSEELNAFNVIITGSDQVWSIRLTNGMDPFYFLDFKLNEKVKKISYAASSEIHSYKDLVTDKNIIKALNDYDAISVRELQLKDILQNEIKTEIELTLDPVYLIDKDQFKQLSIKPKEKDYILIYHLAYSDESVKLAELIAKNKNLDIVEIHAGYEKHNSGKGKYNVGPQELLGYIINADYVITTSFHGIALSILFEKEFYAINKGANQRLLNLLSILGIEDRLLTNYKNLGNKRIDYSIVNDKLIPYIISSKEFLNKNI